MEVTEVKIRRTFETGPMKAIVSLTFDNDLALHDVKIVSSAEKTFVVMPAKKTQNGEFHDIVHPINPRMRAAIETAVLSAYEEYIKNAHDISETPSEV